MLGRRGLRVGVVAAALWALVAAGAAQAGTDTVSDPNDRPGPLDIRSVSQGHSGTKVTHTIRTFANWPIGLLGPGTPNYFALDISIDADRAPERIAVIFSSRGRLIAGVFTRNGSFVGRIGATRPNAHTLKVTIRRARLGSPAGYRWQASSFFRASSPCGGGCTDRAPTVLHDLRAPAVSFPQPTAPPSGTTEYDVGFTVSDSGGSGLAEWRLQHRVNGTVAWTTVATDTTTGAQSYHHVSAASQVDDFRVVAVDGHGTTTVSPVRTVTVPPI